MKLLLIGGYIPNDILHRVTKNTKGSLQFAANAFQDKMIKGFNNTIDNNFSLLSAPFINPFPNGYKRIFFKGFKKESNEVYVSFFNLWAVRNISREFHLRLHTKEFINERDKNKYVIIYSPHVPFLKAAYNIKKKDKNVKLILLIPDLPQFVALSEKTSLLYKLLKPYDIKTFYNYSLKCDAYILLTEHMNDFVNIDRKKQFLIVEGIADIDYLMSLKNNFHNSPYFTIVYSGTLHKKFGIYKLIKAFNKIENKNFRLIICGTGDSEKYVQQACINDKRITYLGQIDNEKSIKLQREADILVNPRGNVGEFTKYSFPSKNIEYLSSGNPVIAYKLEGIADEYDNVLFYPKDDSINGLKEMMIELYNSNDYNHRNLYLKKVKKFMFRKSYNEICNRIVKFCMEVKSEKNC